MYESSFPANDLLRRKMQTGLIVTCLTLTVASTLFLLLFSSRVGVGFVTVDEDVLTVGLSLIFAQFIRFVAILVFVVGAVLVSFTALLMMTQRTRDFGLIKATGCPSTFLYSYYFSELFVVTIVGCTLGVVVGLGADFALSTTSGFQVYHTEPNLLFAPVVFILFIILALIFGSKPIGDALKLSPLTALSTVQYYGLKSAGKAKPFTKSNLTVKVALRSLFRRKTPTLRILLLLSSVFVLLTVSIAGSIIAGETTTSWVQETSGKNIVAVAHQSMAVQYRSLLLAFAGAGINESFNYSGPELVVPYNVIQQLQAIPGVVKTDQRLVLREHMFEIANFTIDPETGATHSVGDNREEDFIVVGIDPANLTSNWYVQGRLLQDTNESNVVVGDWVAQRFLAQPLVQSLRMGGNQFIVVGVCVDPIENGRVVYAPLKRLKSVTGLYSSNLILLGLSPFADRSKVIAEINDALISSGSNLVTFSLDEIVQKNVDLLGSTWSTVMLLPAFTLISAALCLVGYIMLAVEEQRQEFGFLRAMGAKPKTVIAIAAIQSIVVLLASLGFGLPLGTITTLLILMRNPLVTNFTVIEIGSWLIAALTFMFLLSLLPASKLARTPLLRIMT